MCAFMLENKDVQSVLNPTYFKRKLHKVQHCLTMTKLTLQVCNDGWLVFEQVDIQRLS